MPSLIDQQEETRERLLNNVKKEVKQLMEFSVSCKFIHEDNCCISSLCASIDACLLHGLKQDLISTSSTKRSSYRLVKKISKECKQAQEIVEICESLAAAEDCTRNNGGSKFKIEKLFQSTSNNSDLIKSYKNLFKSNSANNMRLFWLKVALIEKKIDSIVEQIQKSAPKYYYDYALMCDTVYGPMVADLLAGPCALEYTRIKTCDGLYGNDQNADELIQRHKMHAQLVTATSAAALTTATTTTAAATNCIKPTTTNWVSERMNATQNGGGGWGCMSPSVIKSPARGSCLKQPMVTNMTGTSSNNSLSSYNPKEYVESLHQNLKTQLVYGKNHICVNKVRIKNCQ